jgi:16S rRNA (guanine(966)-N(2))-methyltransferase RsmD
MRLETPEAVRPTTARLRAALMNIWREQLVGACFLDLFAGSGAVGLEAWRRGARTVVFVESRTRVLAALNRNCRRAEVGEAARVVRAELPRQLANVVRSVSTPFTLVFADPPYDFAAYEELLEGLPDLLAASAEVAIEHSRRVELPAEPSRLQRVDCRRYGDSYLSLFRPKSGS